MRTPSINLISFLCFSRIINIHSLSPMSLFTQDLAAGDASSTRAQKLQDIIDSQDLQKLVSSSSSSQIGDMEETEVEDTEWSSIAQGLEFTRVNIHEKYTPAFHTAVSRFAQQAAESSSSYDTLLTNTSTVNSLNCAASAYQEYQEYQLAWRYLGFAIDCTYYGQYNSHHRHMKSDDATGTACSRVLLYAVYVDSNYGDNGLDQYDFYNRTLGTWNGCSTTYNSNRNLEGGGNNNNNKNNRNRCVKMDCHMSTTENFKLLGIFRNYMPNTWMEQLFKHEGVCVWGWNIYYNMKNIYKMVKPNMCVFVSYDVDNNPYYIGWQPMVGGNLGLMLYSDERCSEYYTGSVTVDNVCSSYLEQNYNNNNNKRDLKDEKKGGSHPCAMYNYLEYFNYQLDEWKLCQPCTSYDPKNKWDCYDDAGYTNCLQCMKFRNKAGSVAAGIDLVKLASRQNGIAEIDICGTSFGYGGFGSNVGPITYSQAAEQSAHNVKLFTKLNKASGSSSSSKTHRDYSAAFLFFGVFAFILALYIILDVQSMFTRTEKKKKTPLLHELS